MPLKIAGCLLLVAAAFSVGALLSKRLVRRRDYLRACKAFISALKTELRFRGSEVFAAVTACAAQTGLRLRVPPPDGTPFESCWREAVAHIPRCEGLRTADLDCLRELGAQLGKTDLDGQLSHLALMETRVNALLAEAAEQIGKKSRLYKTMGFFVGASAAILLL